MVVFQSRIGNLSDAFGGSIQVLQNHLGGFLILLDLWQDRSSRCWALLVIRTATTLARKPEPKKKVSLENMNKT